MFLKKIELNKIELNKKAFTLLEMVTSIALIVIITSIFAANYRSNNKRTDLIMTAQSLVANLHAAQSNTLGLIKYGDEVPAGGWGMHFSMASPSQYILFADLDRPASDEPGQEWAADSGYMSYDSETEGDVNSGARFIDLPSGVEISSIALDNGSPLDAVNVTFLPPDPQTNIFSGTVTSTAVIISLKDLRENTTKRIRINFLGLAEVIDDNFVKFGF